MGHRPLVDVASETLTFLYDIYVEHYPERLIRWLLSCLRSVQYSDIARLGVDVSQYFHSTANHSHEILGGSLAPGLSIKICIFLALLGLLCSLSLCRRGRPAELPDSPRLRAPLHALLSFLTPTTSTWPEEYLHVARRSLSHNSSQLKLPLRTLLRDVLHGTVELRHPAADLPSFILNSHISLGWSMTPSIGLWWRTSVAFKIACLRLSRLSPLVSSNLHICAQSTYRGVETTPSRASGLCSSSLIRRRSNSRDCK